MITLGSSGDQLVVILASGAVFAATLQATENWPSNTQISLHLTDSEGAHEVIWSATVTDNLASFFVSAADVQAVIDNQLSLARLLYNPGQTGALLWGHGMTRFV
jgi:hypothetical protein